MRDENQAAENQAMPQQGALTRELSEAKTAQAAGRTNQTNQTSSSIKNGASGRLTSPSSCTSSSERAYITAILCEIEFGGAEVQAAGAGGL